MLRRLAALTALSLGLVSLALLATVAVIDFPRGAVALALVLVAISSGWHGLVRKGAVRVAGFGTGLLLSVAAVALLVVHRPGFVFGAFAALALGVICASICFRPRVQLRRVPRPVHPVLFWNPRSGGGKATRHHLADEARARGIEPVELTPGEDLEELVVLALARGADALSVAGGDGSQATVARIAMDRGLPFACIPAGTRNHFALDLGVDRDDVVGALDAFVDGGERVIDLGEVNGRIFVNNVSLGLYGEAVQRAGYRDAKVRTLLEAVPEVAAGGAPGDLRWRGPDGREHQGAVAIVVSNNRYRLGHVLGDGTRPRLDEGALGIAVLAAPGDEPGAQTWSARTLEIGAPAATPVGIDGEAVVLEPPLRFRIRPAALRCRIAHRHPGASPSAFAPNSAWAAIRTLADIAAGNDPRPVPGVSAAVSGTGHGDSPRFVDAQHHPVRGH